MENLTNLKLSRVSKWMLANNLIVNASKTVALHITLDIRNPQPELILVFETQTLYPSYLSKYLRITLDDHLIAFLENKIARSVKIIPRPSHYLPPNTLFAQYVL